MNIDQEKCCDQELPDYRALNIWETCLFCEQNIPDAVESTLQPFASLTTQTFALYIFI